MNLCGNNFAPNTSMVTRQLQSTSVLVTLSACGAHCAAGYTCSPYTVSSAMQPCLAGSYCPVDSFATLSATGLLAGGSVCPAGRFSTVGAVACSDCPAGRYGLATNTGLTTPNCSGPCFANNATQCGTGASSPQGSPCPPGYASAGGLTMCAPATAVVSVDLPVLQGLVGRAYTAWYSSANWGTNTSVCAYFGVTCDGNGRVM